MTDYAKELYPFLDQGPADPGPVLAEVTASTLGKSADVTALRRALWRRSADHLMAAAEILAAAAAAGKKVLAFGNGGSATDAQDLVLDLTTPPLPGWRPIPALSLAQDLGVITAVGNDVGYGNVFSRQVIAFGEAGDVAVGFSTSGESENVLEAFQRARAMGLKTIGFAGYEGGRMAAEGFLDAVIVAPSSHIPRIQEAHATAYHALLHMVQAILAREEAA